MGELSMEIVINSRGSYLRKKNELFVIKNDTNKLEISPHKVRSILITTSATLSTDAIKLAIENNIDIVFLDFYGNPYGRIWHSKFGSTTFIRRRQLELISEDFGLELVKGWILQKLSNQIQYLNRVKYSKANRESIEDIINQLKTHKKHLSQVSGKISTNQKKIMGYEGIASRAYFEGLNLILPQKFQFKKRSQHPAEDEFNCLLNYGYGILYSLIERACILAGLDPYIGLLHTDNYNKKSLVFDIIEVFRIHVDKIVVTLINMKKIKGAFFIKTPKTVRLDSEGKKVLIQAFNENFDGSVTYQRKKIKLRNMLQFWCHDLAKKMINYSPDGD